MKEGHIAHQNHRAEQAAQYRRKDSMHARWAEGYGAIRHNDETQVRLYDLAQSLTGRGAAGDAVAFYDLLMALDRLANAGYGWSFIKPTPGTSISTADRLIPKTSSPVRKATPAGRSTWCRPMPAISARMS